jgi:hypothetical protein
MWRKTWCTVFSLKMQRFQFLEIPLVLSRVFFASTFKFFSDFAIGAPFGSSGGSVYVIYGASIDDQTTLRSKRITSPEEIHGSTGGFGWAMAEGNDVDLNTVNGNLT